MNPFMIQVIRFPQIWRREVSELVKIGTFLFMLCLLLAVLGSTALLGKKEEKFDSALLAAALQYCALLHCAVPRPAC